MGELLGDLQRQASHFLSVLRSGPAAAPSASPSARAAVDPQQPDAQQQSEAAAEEQRSRALADTIVDVATCVHPACYGLGAL